MSKKVIIIGAGGHGKVIADIVQRSGDTVLGFLDDDRTLPPMVCGIPLLGTIDDYVKFPDVLFVIGTGKMGSRRIISQRLNGVQWYTAIHPNAVICPMETEIGEGTVVMAGAIVNACAQIGRHCIINTGAIVDHDNRIDDYSHISVGAKLAGTVSIGEDAWIGIGAVVSNNISICGGSLVGAGAVVVHSIEEPGTYVGVPARRIK